MVLYIGRKAAHALLAIRPAPELLDPNTSVFGMTARNIGKRVTAAAKSAGLGEGYTDHSGRVGMAQDLVKSGVELPALMTAGPVEEFKDAGAVHGETSGGQGSGGRYYQEERAT